MILLSGASRVATANVRGGLAIGTGRGAPQESDSELEEFLASTANETDEFYWYDSGPFRVTHSKVYQFSGSTEYNFTEAGVGNTFDQLLSRSLIPDGNGNPTVIKINDDETLRVVSSITFVPPEEDYVWQLNLEGVIYTLTLRSCRLGNQAVWRNVNGPCQITEATFTSEFTLGPNTGVPVIGPENETVPAVSATDGIRGPDFNLVADVDEAAFEDGIAGAYIKTSGIDGEYQLKIDPPIKKTVDERLTIKLPLELL